MELPRHPHLDLWVADVVGEPTDRHLGWWGKTAGISQCCSPDPSIVERAPWPFTAIHRATTGAIRNRHVRIVQACEVYADDEEKYQQGQQDRQFHRCGTAATLAARGSHLDTSFLLEEPENMPAPRAGRSMRRGDAGRGKVPLRRGMDGVFWRA